MIRSIRLILAGSPVTRPPGLLALVVILATFVLFSSSQSIAWATGHPVPMLVGMIVGVGFYVPTLIAIWFFDRREREPVLLMLSVFLAVILIFGPLAG